MAVKAKSKSSSTRKRSSKRTASTSKRVATGRNLGTDFAPDYEVLADGSYTKVTSGEDAFVGRFVDVTGGEHKGTYGVLLAIASKDSEGRPDKAIVRTRDASTARLVVDYKDLSPADAGGRR